MTTIEVSNTMNLSKQSIEILKNFSSINSNLHIVHGSDQITVSPMKNIMVEAKFEEDFPQEFAIWDLSKFLGTLSLFDSPTLEFDNKHVTISSGSTKVVYHFAEPKLVNGCRPTREFVMPETVLHFDITHREFTDLQRAAAVLRLPDLCIQDDGSDIQLVALDKTDPTTNTYSITVGENTENASFKMYLKSEYLKLLPGDYSIGVSDKSVSRFEHKDLDVVYYIALDSDSVYNG
jgi:hypothetical protein